MNKNNKSLKSLYIESSLITEGKAGNVAKGIFTAISKIGRKGEAKAGEELSHIETPKVEVKAPPKEVTPEVPKTEPTPPPTEVPTPQPEAQPQVEPQVTPEVPAPQPEVQPQAEPQAKTEPQGGTEEMTPPPPLQKMSPEQHTQFVNQAKQKLDSTIQSIEQDFQQKQQELQTKYQPGSMQYNLMAKHLEYKKRGLEILARRHYSSELLRASKASGVALSQEETAHIQQHGTMKPLYTGAGAAGAAAVYGGAKMMSGNDDKK